MAEGTEALPPVKPSAAGGAGAGAKADANARLRQPLTVLAILLPLGLLGEFGRWLDQPAPGEPQPELLADPLLSSLGGLVGLDRPWVALAVLVAWCLAIQVFGRRPWKGPSPGLLGIAIGWGLVWAVTRCAIAFAGSRLSDAGAGSVGDGVIATGGLLVSGALQEELLFRGFVLGGLLWLALVMEVPTWLRWIGCIALSAAFFSLAHTDVVNHHAGAEAFRWAAFTERAVAGVLYGYVFVRQGLAVSTLAHLGYLFALEAGFARWL